MGILVKLRIWVNTLNLFVPGHISNLMIRAVKGETGQSRLTFFLCTFYK